ncbi:polysaccharide deacetylase family protein [Paenibacillus sp. KQZ6P-2]|uniref:Polysaccharide deacetylase family protein n=1 Tax=Paenibacillus mangrovi TaxID=2931978 RepID=A0A9X1WNT2_9BACL|nr:polysaccharide deacetylase family protein [Paenibacillus mangrovi]MCJ8011906.1 polysaccharide deacetylase family protein [Paenibacillus mangrovi]
MRRKKILQYSALGLILLIASLFLWRQGPYVYHPARTSHGKEGTSAVRVHGFISTKPTPNAIYYKNKVIVLMYHDVRPNPTNSKSLDTAVFEQQLDAMKANGFHWITMDQYADFITKGKAVPDNAVLLTFDDGYETFYTDVYPILEQYHVPATSFLIVNTVGNKMHPGIPKLNWDQVLAMHRSGIDFYSHTFDSHAYGNIRIAGRTVDRPEPMLMGPEDNKTLHRVETEGEYTTRVTRDLGLSDEILREKLGNTRNILAFPYGGYSKPVIDICHKLGIQVTFSVKQGINSPGQYIGYRVNAGGMDNDPVALLEYMKRGAPIKTPIKGYQV